MRNENSHYYINFLLPSLILDLFAKKFMIYRRPNNIAVFSNATSADMFTVYFIAAINGPAAEINYLQFPSGTINRDDLSITYTGSQLEEEATQRDGLIMITLQQQTTTLAGSTANISIAIQGEIYKLYVTNWKVLMQYKLKAAV